jgi:hypothetical protein
MSDRHHAHKNSNRRLLVQVLAIRTVKQSNLWVDIRESDPDFFSK